MKTLRFGNRRSIALIVKHHEVMRTCEHASGVVARFCPAADVEAYVRACTRAERQERRYDWLISAISAFVAPALMLGIAGPFGLLAAALFIALWTFCGLGQCMTHKAALHAQAVARATSTLCESVTWSPEEMAAHGVTIKIIDRRKSR